MRMIFKFRMFQPGEPISMQRGAEILHVGEQAGFVCIWAIVNPDAEKARRKISVFGTGHPLPDGGKYIGTVQAGELVWHFFDHGEVP